MTRYPVIYADPAWHFETWSEKGQDRSPGYETLTLPELCQLPVGKVAAKNAVLLMWATFPLFPQALQVGEAWGFAYKTLAFAWIKKTKTEREWFTGLGYYTRANVEPCLLFTRGKPLARKNRDVHQIIDTYSNHEQLSLWPPLVDPIGEHSAKPVTAYRRIERLFEGPYVELFARHTWPGWDAIGNEIDGRDIREVIT